MGESGNLFNIPAYVKVRNKKFRVIKLGTDGLILENTPEIPLEEVITVEFVFPYDAYNELVIPKLKIRCHEENGKLFCQFKDLSREQEDIIKFIVREHLWKRIISIPSEFMNYTQDKKVREELLMLQRDIFLKDKLQKILFIAALMFIGSLLTLIVNGLHEKEVKPISIKNFGSDKKFKKNYSINEKENIRPENQTPKDSGQSVKHPKNTKTSGEVKPKQEAKSHEKLPKREEPKASATTIKLSPRRNFYCVQVASDTLPDRLIILAKELEDLPFVRVEKVGMFYTLRVGFNRTYREGKILEEKVKKRIRGEAFSRICAYRPERWVYPQIEDK